MWREIRADYRRYRATGARSWVGVVFFTQGFWATATYRLARACWLRRGVPVLGLVLHVCAVVAQKGIEIVTNISLPAQCEIGPGLFVAHFGPTIVHGDARLGANCNLSQGVSIGIAGRGVARGCPVLGDRVFVGPNAVVFGPITIGDDAAIGAGAVVTKSVPARGVAVGNPAQVISLAGSFDFVAYDGMETDPARREAMVA